MLVGSDDPLGDESSVLKSVADPCSLSEPGESVEEGFVLREEGLLSGIEEPDEDATGIEGVCDGVAMSK